MKEDQEAPMRYAFNHDSDKLQEIFGLPDGYPQAVKKQFNMPLLTTPERVQLWKMY